MKRYFSLLCVLALLAGCYNTDEQLINEQIPSDGRIFTASFEQNDTRTYVEDGNLLRWNKGDQITIFDSNTLNQQYKFDGETGDNGGTFSKVSSSFGTGNDLNCHYAVYPYNKDIKITETGIITATLPAEQSYAENSFGLGANTMVAVTKDVDDTFLKFKNVGGYLKLQLYGENIIVKSITLTGNNNEKIAGEATITHTYGDEPTIVMSDNATTSITLDCGDGVKLGTSAETATAFWIVISPTTFEGGFDVTIADVSGELFTKSTSNTITIERNIIQPMAAFEIVSENVNSNNQILYTATSKVQPLIGKPWSFNSFGANIIEHDWDNATGIGTIIFDGDVTTIGDSAFSYCNDLTSITIPDSVTTIGDSAFSSCQNIAEFEIPYNVTTIGEFAFSGCLGLTQVIIPDNVTIIDDYAFYTCNNLADVTIGNNVVSIGKEAFSNCLYIKEIKIPDSVTTIKEKAFGSCRNLKNVTIGNNVTMIEKNAFGYCSNLMNFDGKYASEDGKCLIINGVLNAFALGSNETKYVISNDVTVIGEAAFWACESLTDITIPKSVTTIEDNAFIYCTNLNNVTIPENVTTIGNSAFEGCNNIRYVHSHPIVPPLLGDHVWDKWDGYNYMPIGCNIYVPLESIDAYKNAHGWSVYIDNIFDDDKLSNEHPNESLNNIIKYTTSDNNIVTPNTNAIFGATIISNVYVDGNGIITFDGDVIKITKKAFQSCTTLTSMIIPNSVTEIGDDAFESCTSLTNVTIPNSVTYVGNRAFKNCTSLISVELPNSITSMGDAFIYCSALIKISLPDGLTQIPSQFFYGCSSLSKVTIPESVTSIGRSAFYGCTSLSEITIPDSVTSIGESAFHTTGLISFTFPSKIKTINARSVYNCKSLENITIPNTVTSIEYSAFFANPALKTVRIYATQPPTITNGNAIFNGSTHTTCVLEVPKGRSSVYYNSTGWAFSTIREIQ